MSDLSPGRWKLPVWSGNYLEVPEDGPWARLHGLGCPPEGTPMLISECEQHTDWVPVDT